MSALLGLVLGLFVPNLILQRPPLVSYETEDLAFQWHPYSFLFRESYASGHFPLWNPYDLSGLPFLAFSHTGSLYPPQFLHFLPFPLASSLLILLHLLLAAGATYGMIRSLGRSPQASFIAGLTWVMAGGLVRSLGFFPSLYVYAWAPLLFLSGIKLARGLNLKWFLLFIFSLLMSFLSGDPETLSYVLIFLVWFLLVSPGRDQRAVWLTVFSGMAVALALAAAQYLPLLESFHHSARAQAFFFTASGNSSIPALILGLPVVLAFLFVALPGIFGIYYYGFLVLPAMALALVNRENRTLRKMAFFYLGLLVYGLFFSNPSLRAFFSHVPLMGKFINFHCILCAAALGMIIIGSKGLDDFIEGRFPRAEAAARYFLPAYGLVALGTAYFLKPALAARVLLGLALVSFPFWRRRLKPAVWLVLISVLDLYGLAFFQFPRTPFEKYRLNPELVSRLSHTDLEGRYLVLTPWPFQDVDLPFGAGMIIKADSIDGFMRTPIWEPFRLTSLGFKDIIQEKGGRIISYDQNRFRDLFQLSPDRLEYLDLLNLRWVISRFEAPALTERGRFRLLEKKPLFYFYENQDPMARAVFFHRTVKAASEEAGFELLRNKAFDLREQLLLTSPQAPELKGPGAIPLTRSALSRPSPDQLVIEFASFAPGYLFVSENYSPGWSATLDGKPVRVWRADYAFRAVYAEPGRHRLRFYYQPVSFRIGLWCSLASLFNALGFGVLTIARKKREPVANPG